MAGHVGLGRLGYHSLEVRNLRSDDRSENVEFAILMCGGCSLLPMIVHWAVCLDLEYWKVTVQSVARTGTVGV